MTIGEVVHRVGVGVGVLLLGVGVALLFLPGIALSLPINLLFADIAALGAVLLAGFAVRKRYRSQPSQVDVPDVELPLSTPSPGHEIDDLIYRVTELREGTIEYREQIRERVTEIAIDVVRQVEGCSRDQAIEQLQEGTWTDNRTASGFFRGGGPSTTFAERLQRRITGGESDYERHLRETIGAIEEKASLLIGDATSDAEEPSSREPDEADGGMDPGGVILDEEGEQVTERVRYRSLVETHHWSGITAFALAALAIGTISSQPAVLLAGGLGLAAGVYARVWSPPELAELDVTRRLSEENPEPGEQVEVTVAVENAGGNFLPDLRLIDRVPPTMRVVEGSPKLGTTLRAGQSVTFRYTLVAEVGEHSWPLQAVGSDPSGSLEREAVIETGTTMSCIPRLATVSEAPVRLQTSAFAGQVNTKTGGDGLEFFSVRDYLPGDPMRRIDWNKYARTGEFSTIDYRQERAAKIVFLFDTRQSSYVSAAPGQKHAAGRSLDAAFDIFASLYDQGHLIGVAAYDTVPCWLGASRGSEHLERVRRLFVEHPALSPMPPNLVEKEGRYVDPMTHVRRQLPRNTQIFLFSPLTDSYTYEVARQLDGAGHLVTVVSPDPTGDRTVGQRLARLERSMWLNRLLEHGIPVVDWKPDGRLGLELEHVRRRIQA